MANYSDRRANIGGNGKHGRHLLRRSDTNLSTYRAARPLHLIGAMLIVVMLVAGCRSFGTGGGSESAFIPQPFAFSDVTAEAGLEFQNGVFRWDASGDPVAMMGGGLCWLDYDQDGWLDLYVVNNYALAEAGRWQSEGSLPRATLFRNDNGHFQDVSSGSGSDLALRGNGCVAADFNLDGFPDLYVTSERSNALLWNNGDGTFVEGAQAAGVDAYGWQTGTAVGDLNFDGWPDLFVAGYADINRPIESATQGFPNSHVARPDLLYLNEGPGPDGAITFREVGEAAGLQNEAPEYGLGALLSDLDQDGDLDLLVANDTKPNRLYENIPWPGGAAADPQGLGFRLAEMGQSAGIDDRNSGMGVASGDYDGDGRFDLLITNMGQQHHSIYRNAGAEHGLAFENAIMTAGVADFGVGWTGWGTNWADIDHDSDLDLIIANGAIPVMDPPDDVMQMQFFANLAAQGLPGKLQELTDDADFAHLDALLARGSALADYDNDGDLDIAASTIGGPLALLRNEQSGGNWLTVDLGGFYPGALVTAVLDNGRQLVCETHAGGSYLSSEDPRCHFGLGALQRVSELRVRWPDGSQTIRENVKANEMLALNIEDAQAADGAWPPLEEGFDDPQTFMHELNLKVGGAAPLTVLPKASPELIALGEALFWDRELSGNRDVSCATCHHPQAATGDALSVSVGTAGHGFLGKRLPGDGRELIPRNAPEIFNRGAAGWDTMFWDGRVTFSEDYGFYSPAGEALPQGLDNVVAVQAMFPVTSRDEMRGRAGDVDIFGRPNELADISDSDFRAIWTALTERLLAIPAYEEMFAAAYPDIVPERLRFQHAANAMAAYEMGLFTFTSSPWNRYLSGDESALSAEALRGAELFYGEAGCARCHSGPLLTDQQYHNIGVPQLGPGKNDEAGFDYGRQLETGLESDMYSFRTPTLHNVAATGPWMHNGSYLSLESAVRHHLDPAAALDEYNALDLDPVLWASYKVPHDLLDSLDPLLAEPRDLSDAQMQDILAFLEALTAPEVESGCGFIPDSVPSGLPLDVDEAVEC